MVRSLFAVDATYGIVGSQPLPPSIVLIADCGFVHEPMALIAVNYVFGYAWNFS
jgi:hypothetical protein